MTRRQSGPFRPHRYAAFVVTLLLLLLAASACTRNRPPWPTVTPWPGAATNTPTPGQDASASDTTSVSTPATGSGAQQTVTATLAPGPDSGLPPMPGNEELTPVPGTPTPEPGVFTYKVEAGDTLYSIARQFDVTVNDLVALNELSDPNALRTGQTLKIPGDAPAGVPTGEGIIHIVQPGETLYGISQQYDVPLDQLAEANQITNPGALRSGQRLLIPVSGSQAPSSGRRVHIIQAGDTLTSIAAYYGVTPEAIMAANDITDPNRLVVGKQLIIP